MRADALLRDLGGDRMDASGRDRLRALLIGDLQALERLKVDIARTVARGGRYAVMFFPEIGHGPWPQLLPRDTNVLASGRVLMDLQDAWLDELLDVVAAARRLDRTVVAPTYAVGWSYWHRLDSLPATLGRLTQLVELHAMNNQLVVLPQSLGALTNLREPSFPSKPRPDVISCRNMFCTASRSPLRSLRRC
jgi:hypothetical protein